MRNIEIKARCPDPERIKEQARRSGAVPSGLLLQVDTYFRVPRGRLKLREARPGSAELIYYDRPDQPEPKTSNYLVVPIPDPIRMHQLLSIAFGLRIEIRKRRELWLQPGLRIHLDEVHGLGRFLEFELAVGEAASETVATERVRTLLSEFGVEESDLLPGSYADLLEAKLSDSCPAEIRDTLRSDPRN